MKGRKPKPPQLRAAEGNPGHRPIPRPILVGGVPQEPMKPPPGMPRDAQDFWNEAVPVLQEAGIIDVIDRAALEMTALAYARVKEARRILKREGLMSFGASGQPRPHPMLAVERESAAMFLRFAEQYALTPVARTRLGLAELRGRSMKADLKETLGKPMLKKVK